MVDRGGVHTGRRERGAVDTIATDPSTEADDAIADLRLGRVRAVRKDAEGTAIDQRVADIAGVVEHEPLTVGSQLFPSTPMPPTPSRIRRGSASGRQFIVG